jgi:hypothetical protein
MNDARNEKQDRKQHTDPKGLIATPNFQANGQGRHQKSNEQKQDVEAITPHP